MSGFRTIRILTICRTSGPDVMSGWALLSCILAMWASICCFWAKLLLQLVHLWGLLLSCTDAIWSCKFDLFEKYLSQMEHWKGVFPKSCKSYKNIKIHTFCYQNYLKNFVPEISDVVFFLVLSRCLCISINFEKNLKKYNSM